MSWLDQLEQEGAAVQPALLDPTIVHELSALTAVHGTSTAGVRGFAAKLPRIRELASSAAVRELVSSVLGPETRLVRSILFTKSVELNWHVAWHQDLSIAVQARADVVGFSGWTAKEGILHVQPPQSVLERMLTVRLHLDDTDETNGALWTASGSHKLGRVPMELATGTAESFECRAHRVAAGGVQLMRPLTLHASRKATFARPRRVIHLEFSSASLPSPLQWAES